MQWPWIGSKPGRSMSEQWEGGSEPGESGEALALGAKELGKPLEVQVEEPQILTSILKESSGSR